MKTKLIIPDVFLTSCPNCGNRLQIKPPGSAENTSCSNCSYIESAGSAHAITFISRILASYSRNNGIDTFILCDTEFTVSQCMESTKLLPLIVENAHDNLALSGLNSNTKDGLGIGVINDEKALLQKRVVLSNPSNIHNLNMPILMCVDVVYQLSLLTKKLCNTFYDNQVNLDLLVPNGHDYDISTAFDESMTKSIGNAIKQINNIT